MFLMICSLLGNFCVNSFITYKVFFFKILIPFDCPVNISCNCKWIMKLSMLIFSCKTGCYILALHVNFKTLL